MREVDISDESNFSARRHQVKRFCDVLLRESGWGDLEGLSCEAGCDEDAVVRGIVDGLSVDEVWHVRWVVEFGYGGSVIGGVCVGVEEKCCG